MTQNPLMALFASEPALVAPEMEAKFEACLIAAASHPKIDEMMGASASQDNFWPASDSWEARYRPYVVQDGILHVPVKGVLLHNFPWQLGNWATGYDYIWRAVERGFDDLGVRGIALVSDSPGGMVAGCFETVDRIFARRGEKPIRAFAHESAYSAAYAIASVADKITVSRTGGVGSIGVVTSHVDMSKRLEDQGFKITFIHAGKHKVDGNPYEALSPEVKARIQARIDELYEVFVSSVARNRDMEEQAIRDTEALTFTATQALSNGLADFIGPLDDALSAFADDLSSSEGDEEMSTQDKAAVDQAALDAARAEGRSDAENANATAVADARKAERARVAGITGCEEAKGRETLASHIAMNTEMSVDDAKAMLAAAPLTAPAAAKPEAETPFDAAMGKDNPELGATTKPAAGDDDGIIAFLKDTGVVA